MYDVVVVKERKEEEEDESYLASGLLGPCLCRDCTRQPTPAPH